MRDNPDWVTLLLEDLLKVIADDPYFAFIWFAFALVTAGLAYEKNRTAFGWFLLGLIFNPFSGLILLFLGVRTPNRQ